MTLNGLQGAEWPLAEDEAIARSVTRCLTNELMAMAGAAYLLDKHATLLDDATRADLRSMLQANAAMIGIRFRIMTDHCSAEVADAATVVGLVGRSLHHIAPSSSFMLDGVIERSRILSTGLHATVRCLPRDVLQALARHRSPGAC